MTVALRITLILASLLLLGFIAKKVRTSKVKLEDSILVLLCGPSSDCQNFPSDFLLVV